MLGQYTFAAAEGVIISEVFKKRYIFVLQFNTSLYKILKNVVR